MIRDLNIKKICKKCIAIMCILVVLTPSYVSTAAGTTFTGPKYNFTDDQIRRIASMCYAENGSSEEAMRAEASLMANLYEKNGDKTGTTTGFINYITIPATSGGWFSTTSYYHNPIDVSTTYLNAVKDVLINGNRYFPLYIDEHDCLSDIASASNYGVSFDPYDRSQYEEHVTIIKNVHGSTYTFYCFPDSKSDPFGYMNINTNSGVLTSIEMKTLPTKTDYYVGDTLNTQGISFVAKYSNGSEQVLNTGYSCSPTTFNTAGVQQVTLTYNGRTTTFNVNVSKKTIDMSGVKFQNKTVTYNGQPQSIQVEGNIPQGVSVKYDGNGKVDVGEYTVTAQFQVDTTKYNPIPNRTATLKIDKANIDMSGVKFQNKTVTYNGQPQSIQVEGNLPQGVNVKYEGNGKVNAGEYTVTAQFQVDTTKYNPIPNRTATLKIEKANPKVMPQYSTDKKLYEEAGLPQISLSQGDTPGTIKWENDTLFSGTKDYIWRFIPTDTVNYNSVTGGLKLTAEELKLTNLIIENPPIKTTYMEGENFDTNGIIVKAIYNDGSSKEITKYNIIDGLDLKAGQNSVTISYTQKGITKTVTQSILLLEKLKIDLEEYTQEINDTTKYISKINPKTTVSEITKKIKTNANIKVYKGQNEITDESTKIGTGMMIKIYLNNEEQTYTAIVEGDCTGDGLVNEIDLVKAIKHYKYIKTQAKEGENLQGINLKSIKFTKTQEYTAVDLINEVKMFKKWKDK